MYRPDNKKVLFLQVVNLLSRILDLDEGVKLDHGRRVAFVAHALATRMNTANPGRIFLAGLLHDIGGIGLEDHVLHHALQNFQNMEAREHASRSSAVLASFRPFSALAEWVRDHHERHDGAGFPAAKSRHEICAEAGILHLADLLDVYMRTGPSRTREDVLTFIEQQSGRAVSPAIAAAAKRLFAENPAAMPLLTDPLPPTHPDIDLDRRFPEIDDLALPDLLCRLLWFIAHVVDSKHQGNHNHSIHVAYYSHYIAKALNHPELDPMETLWAALLHNIGLAGVSREDLQLDYDIRPEISPLYRRHPLAAAEMISDISGLSFLAPIAAAHHEHHDGSGFPLGLKGRQIPIAAQVIALANTYHWLAGTNHTGKEQHKRALAFIEKGMGTLFHPLLAETALEILAIHGRRDISWLQDLPNVYAFFNTAQPNHKLSRRLVPTDPAADGESSLFPRQWQLARCADDLHILSGADAFSRLSGIKDCRHLSQALTEASFMELQNRVAALGPEQTLTLTLRSRNNTDLEMIFTRQDDGYDLLSRGINTAPIFQQRASVFYHNFINNPEAELLLDQDTLIQEVNAAFLKFFRIPKDDLLKTTLIELFRPFLSPDKLQELQLFFHTRERETWSNELTFIKGPEHNLTIQATLYRIGEAKHRDTTYLCRIRDISERKKVEQDFIRRDAELQASVHNTAGMTGESFFKALLYQFITLTRARIGMISELEDNNRTLNPIVFWEDHKFWPPPDKFKIRNLPCQLVVNRGESYFPRRLQEFFSTDFLLRDRNLNSYWGLPLRKQDGVIIGLLSIYDNKPIFHSRNMQAIARIFQVRIAGELARLQTERILWEKDRQLQEQNNALTRMNQLKSDMIAITSHDLKAPLSAIIGYASLLEDYSATLDKEKIQHYIRRIQKEGQKQLTFINKLLDLYRIESGAIELTLEPHRLDILLGSCLSSLRDLARKRGITFELTIDGKATALDIDHLRIGQVFTNLLSNAIKFSPDNGKISVQYEQNAGQVIIHIRDQGPGINEREIDNIFDRYYMGRTDFEIRPEGSGLGLYIVRNIVNLHGGTVSAANNSRGGSCFTVKLPVALIDRTDAATARHHCRPDSALPHH